MYEIGGKNQANSIKSYRRHLQKDRKVKIDNNAAARSWIMTGLSQQWRKSFNKHHD